ncbi:MAG: hypothetical protein MUF77_12880 [Leptospira sp.]|nr:hypothetical protein [Leptospira sp.]
MVEEITTEIAKKFFVELEDLENPFEDYLSNIIEGVRYPRSKSDQLMRIIVDAIIAERTAKNIAESLAKSQKNQTDYIFDLLERLSSLQNGPPHLKYEKEWGTLMKEITLLTQIYEK